MADDFLPTEHELKLLRYLHQRGPKERRNILVDCASETSLIASRGRSAKSGQGYIQGSNGAAPMIVARWMKRLLALGFVKETRRDLGLHQDYRITDKGNKYLRHIADGPLKMEEGRG